MKTLVTLSAVLLIASSAFGQGMRQRRGPMYDQSTVTTISGTIQSVDTLTGRRGNFHLISMNVKSDSGVVEVSIGPSFYLDQQNIAFNTGDTVQVTGSKMQFNGNDVILAAKVIDGSKTITLRDEDGRPVWSRGGMK